MLTAAVCDVFVQLCVQLQPCETTTLYVLFDPAFRDDRYIRIASDTVIVKYQEHGHVVSCTVLRRSGGYSKARGPRKQGRIQDPRLWTDGGGAAERGV